MSLVAQLQDDIKTRIVPILVAFEANYVNDGYATTLQETFENLRRGYIGIDKSAKVIANRFVESSNNTNKQRFYKAIEKSIGVDVSSVIQGEGLEDILVSSTSENVSLIRSIPDEYFKKIENIVYNGTTQGNNVNSMISEIVKLGRSTRDRAKLIARDQTSKLNSVLNQQRQQNLGIEEYVWRTSEDGDRVRETHRKNNGKVFRWDDPPKETGHPGEDIQCRCVAEPVITI